MIQNSFYIKFPQQYLIKNKFCTAVIYMPTKIISYSDKPITWKVLKLEHINLHNISTES
jgi:hypothetical protein